MLNNSHLHSNNMTTINPSSLINSYQVDPMRLSNTAILNQSKLGNTYTPVDINSAITSNRDRTTRKDDLHTLYNPLLNNNINNQGTSYVSKSSLN